MTCAARGDVAPERGAQIQGPVPAKRETANDFKRVFVPEERFSRGEQVVAGFHG